MPNDHSQSPFDSEAQEASDNTQEFWGASRSWTSQETPQVSSQDREDEMWRNESTGSMKAIRDGLAAFRPKRVERASNTDRTREHGIVRPAPSAVAVASREATLGELASGHDQVDALDPHPSFDVAGQTDFRSEFDDDPTGEMVALSPVEPLADRLGLGAVDPLLLRLGAILLIGALLVPLAFSLRSSDDDSSIQTGESAVAESVGVSEPAPVAQSDGVEQQPQVAGEPSATTAVSSDAPAAQEVTSVSVQPAVESDSQTRSEPAAVEAASVAVVADIVQSEPAAETTSAAATVTVPAERIVPACPKQYTAGAGDSWYRIADAAGITPSALLSENTTTLGTTIFAGDEICLPAGATVPAQPTQATTPKTTVATPTTTAAPSTTTAPAPAPAPSSSSVEQIIRDVWPDELEEKALKIAFRESRYQANAYNGWCCYGVFQIYWTVHQGWLDDYGIYNTTDLRDARKNIVAAYAIYQRAGGWGPWGG